MAERKKLKVYLESSFVSYLTGRETDDAKIAADQAHTRRWMREQAPQTFLESYFGETKMKDSPLVTEVRRIRHQIAKECGYDPDRITQHAMEAARRFEEWKRTRATA